MTEPLYWTHSDLREFTAAVVAVDPQENVLALERTAFYPGGGGQPCDLGALTAPIWSAPRSTCCRRAFPSCVPWRSSASTCRPMAAPMWPTPEVGRMRVVDYKSKGHINKRIRLALDE